MLHDPKGPFWLPGFIKEHESEIVGYEWKVMGASTLHSVCVGGGEISKPVEQDRDRKRIIISILSGSSSVLSINCLVNVTGFLKGEEIGRRKQFQASSLTLVPSNKWQHSERSSVREVARWPV